MRWDVEDNNALRSHGGNLVAVLYRLEHGDIRRFDRICNHIGRILPIFDRFQIDEIYGKVSLRWKAKGMEETFGAHLTSEGGGGAREFKVREAHRRSRPALRDVALAVVDVAQPRTPGQARGGVVGRAGGCRTAAAVGVRHVRGGQQVDSATGPGPIGSVVIKAREVAVCLDGDIDAHRSGRRLDETERVMVQSPANPPAHREIHPARARARGRDRTFLPARPPRFATGSPSRYRAAWRARPARDPGARARP